MAEKQTKYTMPDGTVYMVNNSYYLASCDECGWVGSSEECGTDSYGDDSDVYCPKCFEGGCDDGKVAGTAKEQTP